jgi:hypothetical protein
MVSRAGRPGGCAGAAPIHNEVAPIQREGRLRRGAGANTATGDRRRLSLPVLPFTPTDGTSLPGARRRVLERAAALIGR